MMPATTENLKETAELYRWALEQHLMDPLEVWQWCERVAATHPNPPQVLVEAMQLRRLGDEALDLALLQVPGNCDMAEVARRAFGLQLDYLYESRDRLDVVISQFASWLFQAEFIGEKWQEELEYFQQQRDDISWNKVYQEGAVGAAQQELTENVLSFLEHASRGDLTGYERQAANWPCRKKGPQHFYKNEIFIQLGGFILWELCFRILAPNPYTTALYLALMALRLAWLARQKMLNLLP